MRQGRRRSLLLASLAVIVAVGAAATVYLGDRLRGRLEAHVEEELERQARSAALLFATAPVTDRGDPLARRFAEQAGVRVSVIEGAEVIAESAPGLSAAARADVLTGPEIATARLRGLGVAKARADDVLFVAVREGPWIVRAAASLSEVEEAVSGTRRLLMVALGLGLVLALGMVGLTARLAARPLRAVVERARTFVEGERRVGDRRIGLLESPIDRLGRELEGVVSSVAQERDRIETVLESVSEAVFGVDGDGRITLVNGAGLRMLDRSDPPLGEPIVEVLPTLAGAAPVEDGSREITLPGPRHFLARITPQPVGGGRVVVLLDVTRLRQLEQVRKDFVANVSHELRTPVSIIRANAETLRDGALEDHARAEVFLDALLRNAERLSDVIVDLLSIARIEAGRYHVALRPTVVIEAAVLAYEQVERLAASRGTGLEYQLEEGLTAEADASALSHVLRNLLENAIKYTPSGGTVVLVGRRQTGWVRLEVRDDGPGIPAEHRERVFERFYRVDRGRSVEQGGTGLGLAIVKHLVGSMGGNVGVEANSPKGSIFWVELPAA